ncbi:hypothetical protein [Streptomyces sp. 13-12-16]|nr:hypothetical protein [Streptomyces sp. 13-12-16]
MEITGVTDEPRRDRVAHRIEMLTAIMSGTGTLLMGVGAVLAVLR